LLLTLYFAPTSFGVPLLPSEFPYFHLLFVKYVSVYGRHKILGKLSMSKLTIAMILLVLKWTPFKLSLHADTLSVVR
jgi:hypothetical protein